jgi:hypothetical protein
MVERRGSVGFQLTWVMLLLVEGLVMLLVALQLLLAEFQNLRIPLELVDQPLLDLISVVFVAFHLFAIFAAAAWIWIAAAAFSARYRVAVLDLKLTLPRLVAQIKNISKNL